MKFVSAFLVVFVLGALAQTSSAPIAIKDNFGPVMFLRFSPNGGELARLCAFGPVTLFDTASYRRARTFLTEIEHTPEMSMFAYSPDGTRIATSDVHKGTRVWNAADPGKPDRASVPCERGDATAMGTGMPASPAAVALSVESASASLASRRCRSLTPRRGTRSVY